MNSPVAKEKDVNDENLQRWGRDRHEGYKLFRQLMTQPAPMLFTQDHHSLWLGDTYRGRSAFLIASGPSFASLDHTPLARPGVVTMGLNNSVRTFRPNLWCSVDDPSHWIRSVWLDPTIQKFVPIDHSRKKIFNSDTWRFMDIKVGDCPNVVYFKRNEHFQPEQYLWEDCINWGNHKKYGGGRSVILAALRILFILGFRKVYLLGVDLNMAPNRTYHFDQARHGSSCRGNGDTYEKLKHWMEQLRPKFDQVGYQVFNCNPDSALKAFEFISYKDALEEVFGHMDHVDLASERTRNLYDTDVREKEEGTGKDLSWFRIDAPKGLHKCKYCGKRCARASGEKDSEMIQLTLGCEQSRKALWKPKGNRFVGKMEDVRVGPKVEPEAVAEWNLRFGKGGGK